ncbi:dolichyl-diphosphooligosaccharide-protein glycotransferase Ecym_5604 [Eremothecium cymbalariae DBVPG|uniref:Ribophorin II C-terminal domain-containing protein n=1 Tax=Eremothecium cymbalariae (strain CBS 270.75 / DBVPG 7215 / KCTC 17166 / NRRL Y-17582) TaxID=931890 RepID=I6NE48_ERECY|nr:hypothetical protein Ecym_5604 [Eremothecium cymbalariae DBVPG\
MRSKNLLLSAVFLISTAVAFTAINPQLSFGVAERGAISFPQIDQKFAKLQDPIIVDRYNETLEFKITVNGRLDQATLLLGSVGRSLETYIIPSSKILDDGYSYKFKIAISELPPALIHLGRMDEDVLTASLILANEESQSKNIFVELFDLRLAFSLDDKWEAPVRLEAKHEIKHIFGNPPKAAPVWISVIFSVAIFVISNCVLITWRAMPAGQTTQSATINSYLVYFAIVLMEYVFVKYYLGTDIFRTMRDASLVSFLALFVVSRALRQLSTKEKEHVMKQ